MKVLCVAEKPSMSRQLASILSSNGFDTTNGKNKYCKNFKFAYMKDGQRWDVVMTSVLGHVMGMDFGKEYSNWSSCNTEDLFHVPIENNINPEMKDVAENLKVQARQAQILIIWTDCDREGEYIGHEVEIICRQSNSRLDVFRAKYSVVSPRDIHRAMQNLQRLDSNQVAAVAARQEIDLRSGATLTRLQSMGLCRNFPQLKGVISYGSCQFPTLGFVVEQYLRVVRFVVKDFWTLKLILKVDGTCATFNWDRNRIFDRQVCAILYARVVGFQTAKIIQVKSQPTSKWKPLPLRTVEFQKKAAKALRLSSDKLMAIAESLYNKGFISYPRTETDQFDAKFDHRALIENQRNSSKWGTYAASLLDIQGRYGQPRLGKNNDKAHPPIHPTKNGDELSGDDARVYEFIVRSYLAACSQDAKGHKTHVIAAIGEETFHTHGNIVLERNYLEVYPYEGWNDKTIPNFFQGQSIRPEALLMENGKTSPPQLLTEPELIGTMDKNGVGTDATIHEHIKKIIDRHYVIKITARERGAANNFPRFLPTILGLSLVEGYDQIGLDFSLTKPRLRAKLEADLNAICSGEKSRDLVAQEIIRLYRQAFQQAQQNIERLYNVLRRHLTGNRDPFGPAPLREQTLRFENPRVAPTTIPRDNPSPNDSDSDDNYAPPNNPAAARTPRTTVPQNINGPLCNCGKESSMGTTRKPGANQGRTFWSCRTCNFFSWTDSPTVIAPSNNSMAPAEFRNIATSSTDEPAPLCGCGKDAILRTVAKEGPNKGRQFYVCPSNEPERCQFFSWADDVQSAQKENIYRCNCDLIAVKDTAKSGQNAGKAFYRCSKQVKRCTFFVWENGGGPLSSSSMSNNTSTVGGSGRCFKCGEEGHYSSNCPSNTGRSRRGGRGGSRGRGSKRGKFA